MKVLIFTYYWPPSGGAGVQRWLKFCKYLPEFGVEPTVITTLDGDYPAIDYSLEKDVSSQLRVIRTYTPTLNTLSRKKRVAPYGSLKTQKQDSLKRKIAIWIRLNLILPDARRIWNKYAIKAVTKLLKTEKYDIIITTGPPHSTHLVGLDLSKKYNLRWIADFRDPWCDIDYLKNVKRAKLTERLDRKLEQKVVKKCDKVISINQDILNKIGANSKGVIIPNGFDPEDFRAEIQKSDDFSISYFGLISPERNPEVVILALNKLYADGFDEIKLKFYGNIWDKEYLKSLANYEFINFYDYIPHDEVICKMQEASVLLLMINNISDNLGIITGKIFEYIGSKTPILAVGPINGEANAILSETSSGEMFGYKDIEHVAEYIKTIYEGGAIVSSQINQYNRREITRRLVEVLEAE